MEKATREKIENEFLTFKKSFINSEEYKRLSPVGRGMAMSSKMIRLIRKYYNGDDIIPIGYINEEPRVGDLGSDKEGNMYIFQNTINGKKWIKADGTR